MTVNTPLLLRHVLAFIIALGVIYILAAVAYTQSILAGLQAVGAEFPLDVRISATLRDLVGLTQPASGRQSYPFFLMVSSIVAFPIAFVVKELVKPLTPVVYPLAGITVVVAALYLMNAQETSLWPAMPGASDAMGYTLQCLAGAVGGVVFYFLVRQSKSTE